MSPGIPYQSGPYTSIIASKPKSANTAYTRTRPTMNGGGGGGAHAKQTGLSALASLAQQLGTRAAQRGVSETGGASEMTSSPNHTSQQDPQDDKNNAQPPPPAKKARVDANSTDGHPNGNAVSGSSLNGVGSESATSQSAGPGDQRNDQQLAVPPPAAADGTPQQRPTSTQALPTLPRDGRLLVLDIEGCITCQDYARKCHGDYIRRNLPAYLATLSDVDKRRMVRRMQRQIPTHIWDEMQCGRKSVDNDNAVIEKCVHALLEKKIQAEELLSVQGQIWKIGRRNTIMAQQSGGGGEGLEGHIYPDAIPTLGMCKTMGIPVCIYAEPSVKEQMQMMRLSSQGDMGLFISGYFDTATDTGASTTDASIGPKTDPKSYYAIAQQMNVDVKNMVVLSVNEKELRAVRDAGAHAVLRRRPADWSTTATDDGSFPACSSMMELFQER